MSEQDIKYLFFDFETSGIGDFKKQKAIQLAWVVVDSNFNKYSDILSFYFNDVKDINTGFHKNLTVQKIKKICVSPKYILNNFLKDCTEVIKSNGLIVAHNVNFDFTILKLLSVKIFFIISSKFLSTASGFIIDNVCSKLLIVVLNQFI